MIVRSLEVEFYSPSAHRGGKVVGMSIFMASVWNDLVNQGSAGRDMRVRLLPKEVSRFEASSSYVRKPIVIYHM